MRDVPEVDAARHGVWTSAEAVAVGWTRSGLDRQVRAGNIVRLDRDAYCLPFAGVGVDLDRERFAARSVAAVMSVSPAVASHLSGFALAALPTWTIPERACVTVPPRYTGDARHSHLHRATLEPIDVVRGMVNRTSAARTITDVARERGLLEAIVGGDAALHRGMTDLDRIVRSVERCATWPGGRRLGELLAALDGRAESPLESASRFRLAAANLPPPEPQVEIFDRNGFCRGRVDLYWDRFGVVGEVDGAIKYREKPELVVAKQLRRHELLTELNLIVVRWGRADLDAMPFLASRLVTAFAAGAALPASDRLWIPRSTSGFAPLVTA